MKCFLFCFFLFTATALLAQNPEISFDHKGNRVIKGRLTEDSLYNETFYHWFTQGKTSYHPSGRIVRKLMPVKSHLSFVVILGTWCGDTKQYLPKLAKLWSLLEIPRDSIALVGVDRQKQTVGAVPNGIAYTSIPVIVVYYDGKEAGRIIETPKKSVEKDIWKMVKGQL